MHSRRIQKPKNDTENLTSVFALWDKYESIAMHFNDLILKIRIQALGAVAAISTLTGVLNKVGNESQSFNWVISSGVFFFLMIFWVAIWIIDFTYYNRLLVGAVIALTELEKISKEKTHIQEIQLSTIVDEAVIGSNTKRDKTSHSKLSKGRWWFYSLVFFALFVGFVLSICLSFTHLLESINTVCPTN